MFSRGRGESGVEDERTSSNPAPSLGCPGLSVLTGWSSNGGVSLMDTANDS